LQFGLDLVRDIINPISNLPQKVEFVDQERVRAREEQGCWRARVGQCTCREKKS
jgi:hypothetical protein